MNSAWKELVLKWLHCFGLNINSIKDVFTSNLLEALSLSSASQSDGDPFKQLLLYLHECYPKYDDVLLDPANVAWGEDDNLYLVVSLLLLHTSIFHPTVKFVETVSSLNGSDESLVIQFLRPALDEEQPTRQKLIEWIQSASSSETAEGSTLGPPERRSLNLTSSPAMLKAPLEEFLSSPAVHQRRQLSIGTREQLFELQNRLDEEQYEKQEEAQKYEAELTDLKKKYSKKVEEFKFLQEALTTAEEAREKLTEEVRLEKEGRRRIEDELNLLKNFQVLHQEELQAIRDEEDSLKKQLSAAEEISKKLSSLVKNNQEELSSLKQQMDVQAQENFQLKRKCSQLEEDYNQIQLPFSPNPCAARSPVLAPENMGFTIQEELMEKESQNKELQKQLQALTDERERLKSDISELEKSNDAATSSQRKFEIRVKHLQESLDAESLQLSTCKQEKEHISQSLSDERRKRVTLEVNFKETITERDALLKDKKSLEDAKNSLEVKVALLGAKITVAEEREEELYGMAKDKISELSNLNQKFCDMEVELMTATKFQEKMAKQLKDTTEKLNLAKNVELEKIDLEEQVNRFRISNGDLEKKFENSNSAVDSLVKKRDSLMEEKKSLERVLEEVQQKNERLNRWNEDLTAKKDKVAAENLELLKDKIRWQAQLEEARKNVQEAKDQAAEEASQKEKLIQQLVEAKASIQMLNSQPSILTQQKSDSQLLSISKEKEKSDSSLDELSSQVEKVNEEKDSLNKKLTEKRKEPADVSSLLSDMSLEDPLASATAENQSKKIDLEDDLTLNESKLHSRTQENSSLKHPQAGGASKSHVPQGKHNELSTTTQLLYSKRQCFVCKERYSIHNRRKFHHFPCPESKKYDKWVEALLGHPVDPNGYVCSDHFHPVEDYRTDGSLNKLAVPRYNLSLPKAASNS